MKILLIDDGRSTTLLKALRAALEKEGTHDAEDGTTNSNAGLPRLPRGKDQLRGRAAHHRMDEEILSDPTT